MLLYPITSETVYTYVQAASKAYDIVRGKWSEPELDLVSIGLRPGETALDIGANYGLYVHALSKAVGKKGHVYAFEPIPFTFASLKLVGKIVGFSKNVELVGKGCSNENKVVRFSIPVQESGASAAGLSYIVGRNDDRVGKETQVRWQETREVDAEVVRLDDFLPPIDDLPLVKIDIEGAEFFCLQGAANLFEKHLPTTICEINPWYLEGFGVETEDVTGFFTDKGYKIFFYTNENGRPRLDQVEPKDIVEDNYLFLHPSRFERFASILPASVS